MFVHHLHAHRVGAGRPAVPGADLEIDVETEIRALCTARRVRRRSLRTGVCRSVADIGPRHPESRVVLEGLPALPLRARPRELTRLRQRRPAEPQDPGAGDLVCLIPADPPPGRNRSTAMAAEPAGASTGRATTAATSRHPVPPGGCCGPSSGALFPGGVTVRKPHPRAVPPMNGPDHVSHGRTHPVRGCHPPPRMGEDGGIRTKGRTR
ncbi:hypothetical protein GCM10022207_43920 [Streptomyces lannensis]|uniref:Uncharacterized protein n=1 Tax=Streptomyces lannensis TaxID=766498 RepID=A0ABP7KD10_9ACTN